MQAARFHAARRGFGIERDWAEYKLDAERKAGQILKQLKDSGELSAGQPKKNDNGQVSSGDRIILSDLGVSANQSSNWQKLADLPEAEYKLDAERKAGQILKGLKESGELSPGQPKKNDSQQESYRDGIILSDLGVTGKQSSNWQKLTDLPEDEYKLDAERKAAAILKNLDLHPGGRPKTKEETNQVCDLPGLEERPRRPS